MDKILFELRPYFKIIIGNIFLGMAYASWMKPRGIINGGVTSLAMIVNKMSGINIIYLTSFITIILLISSLIFLGRQNLFRSILSSISYNVFFSLFYMLPIKLGINLVFDFILSVIFIAIGYYCCISENSSTVGLDVIALIIYKKNSKISIAKSIRLLNYTVLVFGVFTYGLFSVVLGIGFSYLQSIGLQFLLSKRNKLNI